MGGAAFVIHACKPQFSFFDEDGNEDRQQLIWGDWQAQCARKHLIPTVKRRPHVLPVSLLSCHIRNIPTDPTQYNHLICPLHFCLLCWSLSV
jgi:hypothetical protein